jgi:hypothetical protein
MASLVEKIVAVDDALRAADVPHAFGGALALAFHIEEPRATRDIDVNVFAPADMARVVFDALPGDVKWSRADVRSVEKFGQVRLFWEDNPVDLFFSTHAFHDNAEAQIMEVPFADTTIPVLGATELAVFKAFFNRTKDWADIEAMVDTDAVEMHRALGWLVDLLGPDDERLNRFRALIEHTPPAHEPRFAP